jgi:hypothetical protein
MPRDDDIQSDVGDAGRLTLIWLHATSTRRATALTDAPGANASATIARFCSSLHRRRRSGPEISSTRLIAPSFALVQTTLACTSARATPVSRARKAAPIGPYRTVTYPPPSDSQRP